jgi:3-hydroxymyristoyl/3-hydroxydecanoyl-(acyl carrier protein) dehydratase
MRFLFVDQILKNDKPSYIAGVKHICSDDPLIGQAEGKYAFIPSLIGETIGQLAAWKVMHTQGFRGRPVAGMVAEVKIYRPAYLGESLFLEAFIDALDEIAVEYHGQASVNGELVLEIQGAIGPILPMQDFIDSNLVERQYQEIDRPYTGELSSYFASLATLPLPVGEVNLCCLNFDAMLSLKPTESCRAFKKISRAAPYFADHFPHKPVLPLTVLLECCANLAQDFLQASAWASRYRLSQMQRIKMSEFVQPGDVVETELLIKKQAPGLLILHLRSFIQQQRVCVVDFVYSEV